MAEKGKLKYHFYNPNSEKDTAAYLLDILMEVNQRKLEQRITQALQQESREKESHSA